MKGKSKGPKYQAANIEINQAAVENNPFTKPLKIPAIAKAEINVNENQSIRGI